MNDEPRMRRYLHVAVDGELIKLFTSTCRAYGCKSTEVVEGLLRFFVSNDFEIRLTADGCRLELLGKNEKKD